MKAERITSAFPGGPSRVRGDGKAPGRLIPGVEAREHAWARRHRTRIHRSRSRRVRSGLAGVLVLAGGLGWLMGHRSRSSLEEVQRETSRDLERAALETRISKEVNRALLEIWLMEDTEYLRSRGR